MIQSFLKDFLKDFKKIIDKPGEFVNSRKNSGGSIFSGMSDVWAGADILSGTCYIWIIFDSINTEVKKNIFKKNL